MNQVGVQRERKRHPIIKARGKFASQGKVLKINEKSRKWWHQDGRKEGPRAFISRQDLVHESRSIHHASAE